MVNALPAGAGWKKARGTETRSSLLGPAVRYPHDPTRQTYRGARPVAADRTTVIMATFARGRYSELGRVSHPAPVKSAIRLFDIDGDGSVEITYLLSDGTLSVISPDR